MPVTSDGVVWIVWVVWVGQVLLAGRAAAKLLMAIPHHSGNTGYHDCTTVSQYPTTEYPATEYPATEYPAVEYPATLYHKRHHSIWPFPSQ